MMSDEKPNSKIRSYRDLKVWEKGMQLVKDTYQLTASFPDSEKFGLVSQMRRCSVSIPSNIAEGWGRGKNKYFSNHLRIARGSLYELETQILIAQQMGFTNTNDSELFTLVDDLSKMLNSLIEKVESRENREVRV
jgi:four helix bundle protein